LFIIFEFKIFEDKMIRFLTAGESHGKGLTAIVEGFPSNIPFSNEYVNFHLARRQLGYGRGGRMKIEKDNAEILSGVRFGKTLGSPVTFFIRNKDWTNWEEKMSVSPPTTEIEKITIPRPGHADLTGVTKYNFDDIRNSIERSSARETAARVAVGALARRFLEEFNIKIGSYVETLGGIAADVHTTGQILEGKKKINDAWKLSLKADKSPVRVLNKEKEKEILDKIDKAKSKGDTLGGTFVVVATGVPIGLGSFVHYDKKLNAEIAQAIMSINAVKGVEIGGGFSLANLLGSEVHDVIIKRQGKLTRKTNRAGGIEGGISNGLPIVVRGAMKPIATLMSPIATVDLKNMKKVFARRERSDFTAVPACAVIAESMLAWAIAKFFLAKFGGDSLEETKENYENYTSQIEKRLSVNFTR